ncbi:hypothetical protein MTO96_014241 [Rhipicephalus appendiculatus]
MSVEEEKFQLTSCLFSDIMGFTNMCGSCMSMDIVRLINKLYLHHLTKDNYVFEDNLNVGDFLLRCYLVGMASRPNAEALPTAAGEQAAGDSMLLFPIVFACSPSFRCHIAIV